MLRYLLDSNIVSEPAKPQPNKRVLAKYEMHQRESALPSVAWHELLYGLERMSEGPRHDFLAHYLLETVRPALPILPYNEAAARWHSRERARLESIGRTPPFADSMIAAIVATQNLILVTRNTHDFDGFEDLHIENWFEE